MRIKLEDRKLPDYSKGEEIFNMVSHIVGVPIGIAILVGCIVVATMNNNKMGIVASVIYGLTLILLYTLSSIYHGLTHEKAKKIFQIFDHCAIYFLIAGTCTPIALSAIRKTNSTLGWTLFGIEWGIALIAVILTSIDLEKFNIFSMICYLGMGWGMVIFYKPVLMALTLTGFKFLMLGGVAYTIGVVLYILGSKIRYMHSVFHIFVIIGSVFHSFTIIGYAL